MRASYKLAPTNYIHFDSPVVTDAINKNGEFKTDKVTVKRWGEETVGSKRMYLLKAEEKPNKYAGIINLFLKEKVMELMSTKMEINILDITKMMQETAMVFIHFYLRKKVMNY